MRPIEDRAGWQSGVSLCDLLSVILQVPLGDPVLSGAENDADGTRRQVDSCKVNLIRQHCCC